MTTTREVLDAAERLRDANRMYELDDAGDRTDRGHELMLRDEHILAHAYLAETDPSEITETRLRALGMTRPMAPASDTVFSINGFMIRRYFAKEKTWTIYYGETVATGVTCMGEVLTHLRLSKGCG